MEPIICPNCEKIGLVLISDGYYKCTNCNYVGKSTYNESIFKKG